MPTGLIIINLIGVNIGFLLLLLFKEPGLLFALLLFVALFNMIIGATSSPDNCDSRFRKWLFTGDRGRKEKAISWPKKAWGFIPPALVKVTAAVVQILTDTHGDKELAILVTLIPSKPVSVTDVSLRIAGRLCPAKELSIITSAIIPFRTKYIKKTEDYMLFFFIPKEHALSSKKVQIIAIANEGKRRSKQFFINYEVKSSSWTK